MRSADAILQMPVSIVPIGAILPWPAPEEEWRSAPIGPTYIPMTRYALMTDNGWEFFPIGGCTRPIADYPKLYQVIGSSGDAPEGEFRLPSVRAGWR